MVRPQKKKLIRELPKVCYYKPFGVPLKDIQILTLTITEYESLKLKDYENYSQIESSEMMKVSQPTFNRVYNNAKKKLITAIVEGFAIKIEGGIYKMPNNDRTGPMGQGPMTGRKLGHCNPNNSNVSNNMGYNRGRGRGLGLGRNRNWKNNQVFNSNNVNQLNSEEEKAYLEEELKELNKYKEEVESRLNQL